ncbi:hypothetical protein HP532_17975 [Pseudomonas sp. CrR25]|nr:hypothetical protein [Pseudomonas sp. CrR25]
MIDAFTAFISAISVASGVALKIAWSAWIDKQKDIELEIWKVRASELEKRLSQFYWPIYLRLQRDNVVWEKILDRENPSDAERQKLAFQIEQGVLLPNHAEIVEIIESSIHLAVLDTEFETQILAYLRHLDVYRSIRAIGITDKDPTYFGEPYPRNFFKMVEERLFKFQNEYEEILRMQGIG